MLELNWPTGFFWFSRAPGVAVGAGDRPAANVGYNINDLFSVT